MNERKLIAEVLKRRPGAEGELKYLGDQIFDAEAEIGEATDDPVGHVVRAIDTLRADVHEPNAWHMPNRGVPHSTMFDYLTPYEQELIQARSEALAADAAADESVQKFRERFTGGVPLDLLRAGAFVNSPAAANLLISWFEEKSVPFVDHEARMVTVGRRGRREIVEFQVDPPGLTFREDLERGHEAPEYSNRMLCVVGPRRFEQPEVATLVRRGSPLDQLRKVGERLAVLYPEWQHYSATRFVLTGEAPEINPLRREVGPDNTIILHITPGISPSTVEKAYRRALWFEGRKKERNSSKGAPGQHSAKRVRKLSEKNLKLLRFVTTHIDHRGQRPTGRELVLEWDKEYPEWAYRGNTRKMWRDYGRALEKVLVPPSRRVKTLSPATVA